jgi:hypothetical protein
MAGIFKNLDRADVRITPFRAYKAFTGTGAYTTYSAVLSTTPIELGNDALDSDTNLYTGGYVKDSVWRTTNHLYYKHYYDNAKGAFGPTNHINQPRLMSDRAVVISMPQSAIGEGLAPNTLELNYAGYSLTNDIYNNLILTNKAERWNNSGTIISASNIVFTLKATRFTHKINQTIVDSFDYHTDLYGCFAQFNGVKPMSVEITSPVINKTTGLSLTNPTDISSSIKLVPNTQEVNKKFNFTNQDFAITFTISTPDTSSQFATTQTILQKGGSTEILGVDENGQVLNIPQNKYPYKIAYDKTVDKVYVEKRGTTGTLRMEFDNGGVGNGEMLGFTRIGNEYRLYNANGVSVTYTDTLYETDDDCSNGGPLYILNDTTGLQGSTSTLTHLAFYNTGITQQQFTALENIFGISYGNPYATVGNVLPGQGMIVITDKAMIDTGNIASLKYRGTTTIYETEVSCTVSPNEFGFSNNPSIQRYDPTTGQYVLQNFATGSAFRPFVTQVGLYDDNGNLIVAGKLSQPVQLPRNVDTTFIIRFDR